jgi:uncharacterized membrane protein
MNIFSETIIGHQKTRNIAMRCNQVFSKIFHRSFVMKGHLFLIELLGGIMAFLVFLKQK